MSPNAVYLLYALFALGGVGLYLAMPQARAASTRYAGLLLGLGAIVGGLMLLGMHVMAPASTNIYFYVFAALALFSAARVVTHPKPVYSAVYFVAVVVAVAAMMVLLHAEFLAVALILIYAGAILVTYVFVIMLAQQAGTPRYDTRAREPFTAVVLGFVAMATVAAAAGRSADSDKSGAGERPHALTSENATPDKDTPAADEVPAVTTGEDDRGNTIDMGRSLLGPYVIALEVAGVLLLVAMVGAIALVKKRIPREEPSEPVRPLGEIGKQVEPF